MKIKTSDDFIFEIDKDCIEKSTLFTNLCTLPSTDAPIDILVDSKTFVEISEFAKKDKHVLKKDYNPLELHFSAEMLGLFEDRSAQEILRVANAANYLGYSYLMELCCKILAVKLGQGSLDVNDLGDMRLDEGELRRILRDLDWVDDLI